MSTPRRAEADPARCPECAIPREHPDASCDVCGYDPDRFVTEADTTWDDGSPATRLCDAGSAYVLDEPDDGEGGYVIVRTSDGEHVGDEQGAIIYNDRDAAMAAIDHLERTGRLPAADLAERAMDELIDIDDAPVPAPPADLLTVERPAASRWWGWLLSLAIMASWLLRGCR